MKNSAFNLRSLYSWIVLLFCITAFQACEEYFEPELEDFDSVLVVDGRITDLPGPYTIKLTRSFGAADKDQIPIENAQVEIEEESGESETLIETQPGIYNTSANGIQGIPGRSYKLNIRLENGNSYESMYQQMPTTIPIDTVQAEFEYQYISIVEPEIPGYQFYVTSDKANDSENYIMWSMESTFKYESDFTIDYLFDNNQIFPYPDPTEFYTCWRTDPVNRIHTFNTTFLAEPKIDRLPLFFERADERALSIRYSLLVNQFTISREAHTFWSNIERLVENQESLYNTQPFQIKGNVSNVDDEEETVLGFFMVAGQSTQRIFVDHPAELNEPFSYCEPEYMAYGLIGLLHPSNWPIFVYEDDEGRRALGNDACFDCRELGGTIVKPDFWVE